MSTFLGNIVSHFRGVGKNAKGKSPDPASGVVNQNLCRHCKQIPSLFTDPDMPQTLPHHSSYRRLTSSAKTCPLCLLFLEDQKLYKSTNQLFLTRTRRTHSEFPCLILSTNPTSGWGRKYPRAVGGDGTLYQVLVETGMQLFIRTCFG
jgi:hypothetical protein